MRISDWSSDVCSSDLGAEHAPVAKHLGHYTNMQKRGQSDDAKRTVARHQHPPAADTETCSRSDAKPDGAGVAAGIAWRQAIVAPGPTQIAVPGVVAIGAGHREEAHTSELQSITRTSYAVFCVKRT